MSDSGRERAPFGLKVWKSSQKLIAERSAVRSIAWLDLTGDKQYSEDDHPKSQHQAERSEHAVNSKCSALDSE